MCLVGRFGRHPGKASRIGTRFVGDSSFSARSLAIAAPAAALSICSRPIGDAYILYPGEALPSDLGVGPRVAVAPSRLGAGVAALLRLPGLAHIGR